MTSKQSLKKIAKTLFIFRRDLRIHDNIGLNSCLSTFTDVMPCFIFDEKQVLKAENPYFSNNSVQFMIESLKSLDKNLRDLGSRLFFFYGKYPLIIEEIIKSTNPEAIYLNEDYTPYSIERDKIIENACKKHGVKFLSFHDGTLLPKDKILLESGGFYKKFTPYYRQASRENIKKPEKITNSSNFLSKQIKVSIELPIEKIEEFYEENKEIYVHGGREEALKHLENIKNLGNYENSRDFPEFQTTNLSAYLKFGCVSIREVYWRVREVLGIKKGEPLLRQLYWRDFYAYILYYYPHVIKGAMKLSYNSIVWENDENYFECWKKGLTGSPIVDAGMRCLNKTGYMHNRLRMICSNFLIKILLIDWRWGEKYFANKLVDYDIAQNNGGWQWSSSTGTDSQPYFRIFNPKLQSEKFDKQCKFIFKWIPELKTVLNKEHIHDWESFGELNRKKIKMNYPESIIKYKERKELALEMYKKALGDKNMEEKEEENLKKKPILLGDETKTNKVKKTKK